jgi:CHAD domain-containing protein
VTGPHSGALRGLLHDAFHAAGQLRDRQLAIDHLQELAGNFPAAARLARRLHHGLARRRDRVTRRVRAVRPRQLRAILARWNTPRESAGLASRAARRLSRAQRRLQRAQAHCRAVSSVHRYRIQLKLLRYMRDFSRDAGWPVGGEPSGTGKLTSLQHRLGRITDLQVLLRMIDRFGAKHPAWRRDAASLRRHVQHQQRVLLRSLGDAASASA